MHTGKLRKAASLGVGLGVFFLLGGFFSKRLEAIGILLNCDDVPFSLITFFVLSAMIAARAGMAIYRKNIRANFTRIHELFYWIGFLGLVLLGLTNTLIERALLEIGVGSGWAYLFNCAVALCIFSVLWTFFRFKIAESIKKYKKGIFAEGDFRDNVSGLLRLLWIGLFCITIFSILFEILKYLINRYSFLRFISYANLIFIVFCLLIILLSGFLSLWRKK